MAKSLRPEMPVVVGIGHLIDAFGERVAAQLRNQVFAAWLIFEVRPDVRESRCLGGEAARHLAGAAVDAGMPEAAVHYLPGSDAAAAAVDAAIQPGDVVLVKGSRGTRCDVVVDRLVRERG